jgi:MFS family permease
VDLSRPVVDSAPASGAPSGVTARAAAWTCLAILLVLSFVSFLDRQIISLMVGMIKADLKISDSQIGILQGAAFGLVFPLFAVPLGYAADRYSRRWVIFLGVFFWSVAAVLSGLAHTFDVLLAARIGVGIGEAALGPASASLLSDIFPKHRLGLVFSIYSCGTLLGGAGALAIGGAVISWAGHGMVFPVVGHLEAWQIAFIVTGAPGAILAFLIFMIPEPKRPVGAGRSKPHASWSEVFAFIHQNTAVLLLNVLGFSCFYIVTWGTLAWTPAILERSFGWSIGKVGASLGLFTAVVGLAGQLTNGLIVDQMMAKGRDDAHLRYYAFSSIIVVISGVAGSFAHNAWFYLAMFAPLKFLLNFGGVSIASLQVVTPSQLRGRVSALTGIITSLVGGTFGPSIVAFFTDHVFRDDSKVIYSMGLTIAIFVPLAGLFFALGMKPMRASVARQRLVEAAA